MNASIDMSQVIIPRSDQINADDLIAGPMSVTIKDVAITAGTEQPVSIDIGIPGKVYRPCKSMSRVLVAAWGPDAKAYTGRSLTLYRDPTVKWGGLDVGGIRISHLSHIDRDMTMALTATRATRKPYTVKPLKGDGAAPVKEKPSPRDALAKWAQDRHDEIGACKSADDFARLTAAFNSPNSVAYRTRAAQADPDLARSVEEAFADLAGRFAE